MPRARAKYWRYVQALAWVRWRDPALEPYFEGPGGPDLWRAAKFYPSMSLEVPGLEPVTPTVISESAETQFDQAVRDAAVSVYTVDGITVAEVPPAALGALKVSRYSTILDRGVVVNVVFEAQQVRATWPERAESTEGRAADQRAVEAWLRDLMKGPKPSGVRKDDLRLKAPRRISMKAFDEIYRHVARDVNTEWSRPGRPRKLTR